MLVVTFCIFFICSSRYFLTALFFATSNNCSALLISLFIFKSYFSCTARYSFHFFCLFCGCSTFLSVLSYPYFHYILLEGSYFPLQQYPKPSSSLLLLLSTATTHYSFFYLHLLLYREHPTFT